MVVIAAKKITTTVTLVAIIANMSNDRGSAVDAGVTEVSNTSGVTALVEASEQIGSLSIMIRTGQLESNVITVKPVLIEAPLLTQSSI